MVGAAGLEPATESYLASALPDYKSGPLPLSYAPIIGSGGRI